MAIELNIGQNTKIAGQSLGGADLQQVNTQASTAPILGGNSLRVTFSEMSDLDALIEKLKNENERTKFAMLLTSLVSIGQSLSDAEKAELERGLALADKLEKLNESMKDLQGSEEKDRLACTLLQMEIDALQKQIDQAIQDGKDHNELVASQKEVRSKLEAKEKAMAATQGKIADVKNEISIVSGQISSIVRSVGENTLKTIATELATLTEPEDPESAEEARKEAEKAVANDPLRAIRESLDKVQRELVETIEENRIQTV